MRLPGHDVIIANRKKKYFTKLLEAVFCQRLILKMDSLYLYKLQRYRAKDCLNTYKQYKLFSIKLN